MQFGNSPSDFGHLPPQFKNCDVQIFLPNGNGATQFQYWIKPKGITMVSMICVGAGGGGGGGQSAAGNKGGGGGGSSGTYTSLIVPAIFLPDRLLISVSPGGRGGAAASNGTSASNTFISLGSGITAANTIPNILLSATGGNQGNTGNGGTAGAAPAATTIVSLGPIGKLGNFSNTGAANAGYVGQAGTAGGSNVTTLGGGIVAVWNSAPICGGTGGGGGTSAVGGLGGSITLQAAVDIADGGFYLPSNVLAGGVINGGNGNPGIKSLKPFLNTGGTGGGAIATGNGGNGGNGGYGCGGGGGGAGTTGGRGGDGGDGVVIITSW